MDSEKKQSVDDIIKAYATKILKVEAERDEYYALIERIAACKITLFDATIQAKIIVNKKKIKDKGLPVLRG